MIEIIVFSYNNPQMLSLALKSLETNLPKTNVNVLFSSGDMKTPKGYLSVMERKTSLNIYWHPAKQKGESFKEILLTVLKTIGSKEIIFLTDEDILFKKVDFDVIEKCLNQNDVLCHSLRLGLNTTYCSRMLCENVIKAEEKEDYIKWNWTKHYMDFGYPFSLHGHAFNTKEISKLIKKTRFENFVELEDNLQLFEYYPKEFMTASKESVSVLSPYNPEFITIEEFLDGYTPDFNSMDFSKVNFCEGEIHFENIKIAE